MSQRPKTGGTLALIVAAAIIIIIVGIGIFLLARIIGGQREAQDATDSGNLNVAKTALVSPTVTITGDTAAEFGGLVPVDAAGNATVDLQHFNRLVSKAYLVALNAQDEQNRGANAGLLKQNVDAEFNLLEGQNGVGQSLYQALANQSKTKDAFQSLSFSNGTRMLNRNTATSGSVNSDANDYSVSFMLQKQNAPSNVYIQPGQLPTTPPAGSLVTTQSGKQFLVGYTDIKPYGGAGQAIQCVPMRPSEQPHLVSETNFVAEKNPPKTAGGSSAVPPNAFHTGSFALEQQSNKNLTARSSAIVGVVDTNLGTYPASIPHGFIIIDNNSSNAAISLGVNATTQDVFGGALMQPADWTVMHYNGQPYLVETGNVNQLKNDAPKATGKPTPAADGNLIYPNVSGATLDGIANQVYSGNTGTSGCNNATGSSGGPQFKPGCADLFTAAKNANLQKGNGNDAGGSPTDMIAIEAYKAQITNIRGSVGGSGCSSTTFASPTCTGLQAYTSTGGPSNYHFSAPSTPLVYLNQANSLNAIKPQIVQRMLEMNPNSNGSADFDAVMNSASLKAGDLAFLYYDSNAQHFTIQNTLPGGFAPSTFASDYKAKKLPDGLAQDYSRSLDPVGAGYVNVDGQGGYPHPFDCPYTSGLAQDHSNWTPSSGKSNLLGVLKFSNCMLNGTGSWCCPC